MKMKVVQVMIGIQIPDNVDLDDLSLLDVIDRLRTEVQRQMSREEVAYCATKNNIWYPAKYLWEHTLRAAAQGKHIFYTAVAGVTEDKVWAKLRWLNNKGYFSDK